MQLPPAGDCNAPCTPSLRHGQLAPGFALTMTARQGTLYYTGNGADPRVDGTGKPLPGAATYSGTALPLTGPGPRAPRRRVERAERGAFHG